MTDDQTVSGAQRSSGSQGGPGAQQSTEPRRSFDPLDLRRAFSQFPQGVVIVAAEVDGRPEGLVASTFTVGVSLEPPLVTFAVQHTSSTWPKLRDGGVKLGVSVLGRDQFGLCRQLASKDRENRFTGVGYSVGEEGALVIDEVPMWLKTRVHSQFTAGDHDVVVLEILDLGVQEEAAGLVFHQSEFKELTPLTVQV